MRESKTRTAVVDIDGILWSMAPAWNEELQKINTACPFPGSTSSWNFNKGFMAEEEFQGTIDAVHMKQYEFSCFEGAPRLTNMLHSSGFYVKIASHRTYKSFNATKQWLDKHGIYYDELHTVNNKHGLLEKANLFIDDSPASQEYAVSKHITTMSIKYPYNKHVKGVLFFDDFNKMLYGAAEWLISLKNSDKKTITSVSDYNDLKNTNAYLIALEGSGVDNWEDYEKASKKL